MQDFQSEYERFIRPIEDQMMSAVWGVTQNPEDAEEAFQEALSVLWRKWRHVRAHPNPRALILRICFNSGYDVLRKRSRRQRREITAETSVLEDVRAAASSPSETLAARERESAVLGAISRLTRNQAAAVVMKLWEGCSHSDIAEALGCRDATARKHLERGRQRLRELLAPVMQQF